MDNKRSSNSNTPRTRRPSAQARSDSSARPAPRRASQVASSRPSARTSAATPSKRRSPWKIALVVLAALCVLGAGSAFAYYQVLSGNLHNGVNADLRAALVDTDLTNEPFYLLLMGTDGSSDRASSEEYAGDQFRSDSMILTRINPVDKKVTMVSIHRDTLVDMGEYGQNKLNAAHALGGPALTVETVSQLAGVPISHYAELNFDGFKDIVDALGGVEVDVPMEIDDEDAGGHLDAGVQTLNGDQALILCRSRHAYDEFGDGDSYRAANQRLVLAAIAKKILAADIGTMASTVTALTNYVTTDLEITDIIGLAQTMQGLDPSTDIYSGMEPTTSEYIDGVWYELNDTAEWQAMMARVDQGLPPTEEDVVDEVSDTILASTGSGSLAAENGTLGSNTESSQSSSKSNGTVSVRNGNGIAGAGTEAATRLEAQGYTVDSGNADDFDYPKTLVIYSTTSQATEAKQIASALGVGTAQMNDGSYVLNGDFLVVLGADWK